MHAAACVCLCMYVCLCGCGKLISVLMLHEHFVRGWVMFADLLFCSLFLHPVLLCLCLFVVAHNVCGCCGVCGCLSLVSVFISRKCFQFWQRSTAWCRPLQSSIRQCWPNRRNDLEKRSLVCRCVLWSFITKVFFWKPFLAVHVLTRMGVA